MTKMEELKQKAKDHPFQVIQVKDGDNNFLMLDSLPCIKGPESWRGITIMSANFLSKSDIPVRLRDLKEDWLMATEGKLEQVNWNPITL